MLLIERLVLLSLCYTAIVFQPVIIMA